MEYITYFRCDFVQFVLLFLLLVVLHCFLSLFLSQAIKQMYVLVLGLDVLGNPFGIIRGLATGIENLFYEPYQGAIQGPEEFAEGLALGVRSLLGHAVGKTSSLNVPNYYKCFFGFSFS